MTFNDPTTSCQCALLTGAGRSAVAVVGVRGAGAAGFIQKCFTAATSRPLAALQVRYGMWTGTGASTAGESVVVVPVDHEEFEVHCHGGAAATARIINDLRELGASCVEPDVWLAAQSTPRLIQEATEVLARCLTSRMASVALGQVRGALANWAHQALESVTPDLVRRQAAEILDRAKLGLRLGDRFSVVLLGAPNVGKSSLVNAMVGYDRSITMDLAGTTRDVLHADTVVDGIPIRLSDTAGIRHSDESIEKQGVSRARNAAEEADLVILVSDPDHSPMQAPANVPTLQVLNKADLLTSDPPAGVIATIATNGQGIDQLMSAVARELVEFPEPGAPVPVTPRQVAALTCIATATEASHVGDAINDLLQRDSR